MFYNARDARAVTDPAYNAFVEKVNAAVVFKGEAIYAAFIDKVNYLISYAQTTLAARQGRTQSAVDASTVKNEN